MEISYGRALWRNFLGQSPDWYKLALIIFLIVNPLVFAVAPFVAGWLLVVEFIFTLAMALKCYPLLPGGLLAIEALLIGMTSPAHVREEIAGNLEVLLLLIFMVAVIKGVAVLNINELANAMKPMVIPGERMTVTLIKQGKDHNQAIAYLDDGTMIVVEDGRREIGKVVEINVTSVLQTAAGRMIFGKLK